MNGLAFLAGVGADYALTHNMKLTFNYSFSGVTGAFDRSTLDMDNNEDGTVTGQLVKSIDQTATVGLRFEMAP